MLDAPTIAALSPTTGAAPVLPPPDVAVAPDLVEDTAYASGSTFGDTSLGAGTELGGSGGAGREVR